MNCTWNGNIPAVSLGAPASSVADSFGGAIATAPLGKGSILCFMLSNIKLWAVDSKKMINIQHLHSDQYKCMA